MKPKANHIMANYVICESSPVDFAAAVSFHSTYILGDITACEIILKKI